MHWKRWLIVLVLLVGGAGAVVLWRFDPREHTFYPRCPFKAASGLDCPGCGSTRALHSLLHLHFADAFRQNALLVVLLPLILWWFGHLALRPERPAPLAAPWIGWALLVIVLLWWIARIVATRML